MAAFEALARHFNDVLRGEIRKPHTEASGAHRPDVQPVQFEHAHEFVNANNRRVEPVEVDKALLEAAEQPFQQGK